MVFIQTNKKNEVVFTHYYPEQLSKNQKEKGFLLKELSEPIQKEGFSAIQYYTPDKGFWTEYQELPKSKEELLEQDVSALKNKLSEMQKAMAEMSMTIAMKGGVN